MLFNWAGYGLFTSFMESRNDAALESRLDNNSYEESQLLSIKIPITSLPYYSNSRFFERADGQIEIAGIPYKFVKRRIYNDSLELLCIQNKTAIQLRGAKEDFYKLVNDLQFAQTKKANPHGNTFKCFSLDNYTLNDSFRLGINGSTLSRNQFRYLDHISFEFPSTDEHPPDIIA
jgi:hypothetical protein